MKKLSLSAVATTVALAVAAPAQSATVLGAKVGAEAWAADTKVDSVRQGDDSAKSMYVAFEHFVPLVPNFKLRYTQVGSSHISFDQVDYTAYYEILDNDAIAFDVGFTMTKFNKGTYTNTANVQKGFSEWAPNIYSDVTIGVPLMPIGLFGQFNFGSHDGTSTFDGEFGVKYTLNVVAADVNIKAGYRVMDHDFGYFTGTEGEVMIDGWFAGLELDF